MATVLPQPEEFSDRLRQYGFYLSFGFALAGVYVTFYGSLAVAGGLFLVATALVLLSFPYDVLDRNDCELYLYNGADVPVVFDLEVRADGDDETRTADAHRLAPGDGMVFTDHYETDTEYTVSITVRGGRELRTQVVPARSTADDGSEEPYVAFTTTEIRSGWHRPDSPRFSDRISSYAYGTSSTDPGRELEHDW